MPKIPYQPADITSPQELVSAIRTRRGGTLLNLDRMLLHSPTFAAGWNNFIGAVRNSLTLPGHLRELAICAVAVLNGAEYEFFQHAPEYLKEGGRNGQLEALKQLNSSACDTTEFNRCELAVIKLCIEMTRTIKIDDATLKAAQRELENHQQVVELVGIISAYNMVSRFLVALGIEPENCLRESGTDD